MEVSIGCHFGLQRDTRIHALAVDYNGLRVGLSLSLVMALLSICTRLDTLTRSALHHSLSFPVSGRETRLFAQ